MRNSFRTVLFGFVAFAVLCGHAKADKAIRWVDKEGGVHYTDSPPDPALVSKPLQVKSLESNVVGTTELPYSTREAQKNYPVTIYISDNCQGCTEGKKLLDSLAIPYTEKKLISPENLKEYSSATRQTSAITPTLLVGETAIQGFQDRSWRSALELAGYPVVAQKLRLPIAAKNSEVAPETSASAPEASPLLSPEKAPTHPAMQ